MIKLQGNRKPSPKNVRLNDGELLYTQQFALTYKTRKMKTSRLRKKLLKNPAKYVRFAGIDEIFKFHYTDPMTWMLKEATIFGESTVLMKEIKNEIQWSRF